MIDLGKLRRAFAKLPATVDRPIARRNARRRVLGALRAIRAELDREFPAIVKPRGETIRATWEVRCARMEKSGWRAVSDTAAAEFFAGGGVRARIVSGKNKDGHPVKRFYVPGWAFAIGYREHTKLRAARRSVTLQRAALAAKALTET